MKTNSTKTPGGPLLGCLLAVCLAASIVGCTTTVTSRPMSEKPKLPLATGSGPAVKGIPYYLPRGVLEVTIESLKDDKAKHKEFKIGTATKMVPDPRQGYVLDSADCWAVSKIHDIKLTDSMLSLVSTQDENKVGEIIGSVLSSVANVAAFGAAGGAKVEGLEGEKGPPPPTDDELTEIYSSVSPGAHSFGFVAPNGASEPLPGTRGLLKLGVIAKPGAFGQMDFIPDPAKEEQDAAEQKTTEKAKVAEKDGAPAAPGHKRFRGIFTRVLTPMKHELQLQVPWLALIKLREVTLPARKKANEEAIKELKKGIEDFPEDQQALAARKAKLEADLAAATASERAELKKQIKAVEAAAKELVESNAAAPAAIAKLETANTKLAAEVTANAGFVADAKVHPDAWIGHYVAQSNFALTLVPDERLVVALPITRAWLGVSKNTVTLESGILTEYKVEKDSTGLAVAKIFYNATEQLIALPTKILQLKIDYSSKQKELINAQKELDALKDEVAKLKAGPAAPTDHEQELDKLTKEKEILALEKDIAELKSQLDKLASGK